MDSSGMKIQRSLDVWREAGLSAHNLGLSTEEDIKFESGDSSGGNVVLLFRVGSYSKQRFSYQVNFLNIYDELEKRS